MTDKRDFVKQRILAMLDYDGIQECDRIKHLMTKCNISRYMAKRALKGVLPKFAHRAFSMADDLEVCPVWLGSGKFCKFHPRTALIQMVMIDGKEIREAERSVESIASEIPGEPTYVFLGWGFPDGKEFTVLDLILLEQRRRMTEWEKGKHLRLMLRLLNDDPKALRLCGMVEKGQITRAQLFAVM